MRSRYARRGAHAATGSSHELTGAACRRQLPLVVAPGAVRGASGSPESCCSDPVSSGLGWSSGGRSTDGSVDPAGGSSVGRGAVDGSGVPGSFESDGCSGTDDSGGREVSVGAGVVELGLADDVVPVVGGTGLDGVSPDGVSPDDGALGEVPLGGVVPGSD